MSRNDSASIERGKHWAHYLDAAAAPITTPAAISNGLRLVAMGDSWFNYFPPFDLLVALQRKYGYAIDSVAVPGAHLVEMAPPADWDPSHPPQLPPSGRGRQLNAMLGLVGAMSPAERDATRAILLSGGGNDVAADRQVLAALLNPASSGLPPVNDAAVTRVVDTDLRAVLAQVLSATTEVGRLRFGRAVPILIHGYAHPVPDGRGAGLGAWLRPVLQEMGYADLQAGADIMARLIDRLNLMQMQLLADNAVAFAHVTHVDLRSTLSNVLAADAYKLSWQNELHPTIPGGFTSVADKIELALRVLPLA